MFPTLPGQAPSDPKAPVPPPVAHPVAVLGVAGLAALLGAMTMLGPFAIDTYLPAFPAIMDSLNASSIEVQQTLMVYMLAWSGMTLWHGALSDTFGRRNVILCSLLVFAVGTFGCAASHSVHYL